MADIYLTELFDTCLRKLAYKLHYLKNYVDNRITTVPEERIDQVLPVLNEFSRREKNIFVFSKTDSKLLKKNRLLNREHEPNFDDEMTQ